MRTRHALTMGILLGLATTTGWAGQPVASRDQAVAPPASKHAGHEAVDAFGDPDDFGAALLAGADYLVRMQADVTEDNAGNGFSDIDPDDAGWDWALVAPAFSHSAAASPTNTVGETALGLVKACTLNPQASYMTALSDVATRMIAVGPTGTNGFHHSADVLFLLEFADIAVSPTPAACRSAAQTIWIYQRGAGTATDFAVALRETRGTVQGYHNGVVPWDLGAWAKSLALLDAAFPGQGYDTDADDVAEVMWQDSFNANPGYFQPYNPVNQGFDPTWTDRHFWWYTLGLTGLIDGFAATGSHTAELAGLQATLLDCQYPGGAFSGSYGANTNDEDWQTTGYVMSTIGTYLSGLQSNLNQAASWLASTQDASGGFLYSDDSHYPSVAGQCVAGMAYSDIYRVVQSPPYLHMAVEEGAPHTDRVTTNYALTAGSEPYRALTVFVDYDPAVLRPTAVTRVFTPGQPYTFQSNVNLNPNGHLEISLALLGNTAGISGAVPSVFTITWDGLAEDVNPGTALHIAQVVMRDPNNANISAYAGSDIEIEVDATDPTLAVTNPSQGCVNANFSVTLDADDNVNLDRIEYQFDGADPWLPAEIAMSVDSFFDVFLVDIGGLDPGDHTIVWRTWDDVGHVSALAGAWSFHKDFLAPTAAGNLVALPGDHGVSLSWTPGTNLDGYELWRAVRATAYPYVGGRPPVCSWPADFIQLPATIGAGATAHFDDFGADLFATRGIYDYVLVSTDCVNDDAASGIVSATNYFLGDWASPFGQGNDNYDGFVCAPDLAWLATVYGTLSADSSAEMDVAPTHNMGRFGLPGPDTRVNFEDLIVLAMNYRGGCSSPLLQIRRGDPGGQLADAASSLLLAGSGTERQLLLDGSVLGFTAELATTARLIGASSTQGSVFFYRTATGWTVDVVGLADLLAGDTVVSLRFEAEAPVNLLRAEGRDESNVILPLAGTTDLPPAQPTVFALAQNQPNPFNPTTTIRYSLAADGPARLAVYNCLGQQVALLLDGAQRAGAHELGFDGSALASGVYVYRLEAAGLVAQQKMILVKESRGRPAGLAPGRPVTARHASTTDAPRDNRRQGTR